MIVFLCSSGSLRRRRSLLRGRARLKRLQQHFWQRELRVREGLLAVWSFLMGRRRAAKKITNTAVAAWSHEALPRDHQ